MRCSLILLLLAGFNGVRALPPVYSVGSSELSPPVIDPTSTSMKSMVVPPDYPEYRATVSLTVENASDPKWNGAALVPCSGDAEYWFFQLCADKAAVPYPLVFQDVMGIAGQDLGKKGNWAQHTEAYLPMTTDAQSVWFLDHNQSTADRAVPTNRLFEGLLMDSNNSTRRVTTSEDVSSLSFFGRHTNSSMYNVRPDENATDYTWGLCLSTDEYKWDESGNGTIYAYLKSGRAINHCRDVTVQVRMEIVQVLAPIPGRNKTKSESPWVPRWRDTPLPQDELLAEKLYYEELTLSVDAEQYPDFDGLALVRCDPKPFYDFPHIPRQQNGLRDDLRALYSLNTIFAIYYRTLALCADKTEAPTHLLFESQLHLPWFPREKSPRTLGRLNSLTGIEGWDHEEGYVGFNANGSMHRIERDGPERIGDLAYDFLLCDEVYRNKTIHVLHQPNVAGEDDLRGKIIKPQPGSTCRTVGVRGSTIKVLTLREDGARATTSRVEPKVDPSVPLYVQQHFGGRDFEYYDWVYNLSSLLPPWMTGEPVKPEEGQPESAR